MLTKSVSFKIISQLWPPPKLLPFFSISRVAVILDSTVLGNTIPRFATTPLLLDHLSQFFKFPYLVVAIDSAFRKPAN